MATARKSLRQQVKAQMVEMEPALEKTAVGPPREKARGQEREQHRCPKLKERGRAMRKAARQKARERQKREAAAPR